VYARHGTASPCRRRRATEKPLLSPAPPVAEAGHRKNGWATRPYASLAAHAVDVPSWFCAYLGPPTDC